MKPQVILALLAVTGGVLFSQQQRSPASQQPEPVPSYNATEQKIVWTSGSSAPGDSVVVTGAFSVQPKTIRLAALGAHASWTEIVDKGVADVRPLSQDSESMVFGVPSNMPSGVLGFRISDGAGTRLYGRINLPEIYWVMGIPSPQHITDPGASITPAAVASGGRIRVFGRNFGPDPQLVLRTVSGRGTTVALSSHSNWSLTATIPETFSAGSYEVLVRSEAQNDNTAGPPAQVRIFTYSAAPPKLLDVQTCGVRGDGVRDDATSIQECLNRSAPHAGSLIVQFQAKSYVINRPISLPPHVYLQGIGQGKTIFRTSLANLSTPLFTGGAYFGLSQMTIQAPAARKVLGSRSPSDGHMLIDHVTIEGVEAASVPAALPDTATQLRVSAQLASGDKDTVNLTGDDVRITNSEIRSAGRALILSNSHGVYLSNDVISDGPFGWYSIVNSGDVIFENSRVNGVGSMASGGSYAGNVGISENIYTEGNVYERMPAANGEAFTSDGPGGAYFGPLATVSGAHLELAGDPNWKNRSWLNSSVVILGGRGAGQYRLIRNWSGRNIELQRPFDVTPDRTSVVTVVPTQRHYILVNNHVTDAGVGIQFYGTIFQSVIANNTLSRAGGIFLHAARYGDGIQPNLFVEIVNNTILRKGSFRGGSNNPGINNSGLIQVQCLPPSLTVGVVVRQNHLGDEAIVNVLNPADSIHGLLIEKNAPEGNAAKIRVQRSSPAIVIRNGT